MADFVGWCIDEKTHTLAELYRSAGTFTRLLRLDKVSDDERCIQAYCSNPSLKLSPTEHHYCVTITCSRDRHVTLPYAIADTSSNKLLPVTVHLRPALKTSRTQPRPAAVPSKRHVLAANPSWIVCPSSSLVDNQITKFCTFASCYAVTSPLYVSTSYGDSQRQFFADAEHLNHVTNVAFEKLPEVSACAWNRCFSKWLHWLDLSFEQRMERTRSCIQELCCYEDLLTSQTDEDIYDKLDEIGEEEDDKEEGESNNAAERHDNDSVTAVSTRVDRHEMTRERRVNDDVSQCIQSYCSGKMFPERLRCIVKNCHRSSNS